jgi:hypothetical protein
MSKTKKTPTTPSSSPQTLKIGNRVRCIDDGVEGRIVWANGISVKIRWDDGEQVTWRRDSLSDRPIEILAEDGGEDQALAPNAEEQNEPIGFPQTEQNAESSAPGTDSTTIEKAPGEQSVEVAAPEATEVQEAVAVEQIPAEYTHAAVAPRLDAAPDASMPPEPAAGQSEDRAAAKRPRQRKPKAADDGKQKRLSALDAAAKVLEETGQAMTCPEIIVAMAEKKYWTSPGGKTPQATLHSAIAREITAKGAQSRFVKAERGKFARNGTA